jgi:hypothetical protein
MSNQPQWKAQTLNEYTHSQPQWGDKEVEVASRDTLSDDQQCQDCRKNIKLCKCAACYKCKKSLHIGTRHHCRKCWRTVCSDCRKRQRYLNPFSPKNTNAPVCDTCAQYKGISKLPEGTDFMGLYLLREAADLPRRCVGARCGIESYDPMCPSCNLPTVSVQAHLERLVRVQYCCDKANKCAKCSNVQQRMDKEEEMHRAERETFFNALTPQIEDELFDLKKRELQGVFEAVDEATTRRILLATIASSVCYEYDFYPQTTLSLSDIPFAKLLHLRETKQAYSIFEGPRKTIYMAFPGTHDLRTTITDVKFSRILETEWTHLHEGLRSGRRPIGADAQGLNIAGPVQKLWEYKVHAGFSEEEATLRRKIPTNVAKGFIAQGYQIVICGHSLGGALAALTTLRHLKDDLGTFQDKILCVTLGAPLIGNSALTRRIQRSGWTKYFHHLVYRSDVVPRLLTGRKLPQEAVSFVKQSVVDAVSSAKDAVLNVIRRAPIIGSKVGGSAGGATPTDPNATTAEEYESIQLNVDTLEQCFVGDDDTQGEGGAAYSQATTSGTVPQQLLLVGAKRSFDCYGRYHFLNRDVPYKSTTNPDTAFYTLKGGDKLSISIKDHLLGSYNKALMFRVERSTKAVEGAPKKA